MCESSGFLLMFRDRLRCDLGGLNVVICDGVIVVYRTLRCYAFCCTLYVYDSCVQVMYGYLAKMVTVLFELSDPLFYERLVKCVWDVCLKG